MWKHHASLPGKPGLFDEIGAKLFLAPLDFIHVSDAGSDDVFKLLRLEGFRVFDNFFDGVIHSAMSLRNNQQARNRLCAHCLVENRKAIAFIRKEHGQMLRNNVVVNFLKRWPTLITCYLKFGYRNEFNIRTIWPFSFSINMSNGVGTSDACLSFLYPFIVLLLVQLLLKTS